MLDSLSKFPSFIAAIIGFAWDAFPSGLGVLFDAIAASPIDSFFEVLFVLFLFGFVAALLGGLVVSLLRLSPAPFIRAVEFYVRIFAEIGAWILIVLIVAMVYEVLARYFFSAPTKWAFEMAYMLMGTSFMFAIAFCLQKRRHIRVDFLYDHVSDKKRAVIDLFGYLLMIPMVLWLSAGLWDYFQEAYRVQETSGESAWNPIIWPFKFTLVIGFLLLLAQTLVETLKSLLVLIGRPISDPSAPGG